MLVEDGKFTFPADFVILEMEEDSKVTLILGRPFFHTVDAVIRVKQKQLNLKVGSERMIFHIDFAMKPSYSNDDTCFSIDVIDEILEEDFDSLLNEGSEILHSIEGTILEEKLFAEFDEFMAMTADENSESESDTKEPPFEKITFNTDYKTKTSLEEPPTNLQLKPLPNNLEYAWDRYKDLLRAYPHHGFTELHQLDIFYNALNPADQNSLNSAAGGNLLERHNQDVLTIIENKSKVRKSRNKSIISQVKSSDANSSSSSEIAKLAHAVNQQTSVVTAAMTAILKKFQATPPSASVKAVEEICVTCGGARPYYQCLAAGGNTFWNFGIIFKDTFQQPQLTIIRASMSNQTNELKNMMASVFQMNTASTSGSGSLPSNTIANPKEELKAITTRSGIVLDVPSVPIPPLFINPEEDERVEETLTDQDLAEYTIKVSPPLVQKPKLLSQRNFVVHQRDPLHPNILYLSRMLKKKQQEKDEKMLKALISNKEKLLEMANTPLNENCSAVILKKLHEKLRDPGKFLIPCGFSELKCKALADLGASINLMPLSVWKKLGLPELISTRMTLELANRVICTPAEIARDIFVSVGKFTFPADFVIVNYESDPRVPLILERPFLRTARALIDVHGEKMILCFGYAAKIKKRA
nr:reverse transcriptase domain-containing protein [Tanacetum cinerariifolium]